MLAYPADRLFIADAGAAISAAPTVSKSNKNFHDTSTLRMRNADNLL
ncbi:MAG: hypothetical protein GF344_00730 [Chitinivibrionales bacterium]|nr:hypothetical protein [Chitinivibrionales bacterium]